MIDTRSTQTKANTARFKTNHQRRLQLRIKTADGRWFHPDAPHGTLNGYQHYGCRCDTCTFVNNQKNRQHRRERFAKRIKTADGRWFHPDASHGTLSGYGHFGCRCDACTLVNSANSTRWALKTKTKTWRFHTIHPPNAPTETCGTRHPTRRTELYDHCPRIENTPHTVICWLWHRPECRYTATALITRRLDIDVCTGDCGLTTTERVVTKIAAALHTLTHIPDDETDEPPNVTYDFSAFTEANRQIM